MIIPFCFANFWNFSLLLLNYLKFYSWISISFEFWKFQTQNLKQIVKDKKVNITVIYLTFQSLGILPSRSITLSCMKKLAERITIRMIDNKNLCTDNRTLHHLAGWKSIGWMPFTQHLILMTVVKMLEPVILTSTEGIRAKLGEGVWALDFQPKHLIQWLLTKWCSASDSNKNQWFTAASSILQNVQIFQNYWEVKSYYNNLAKTSTWSWWRG